MSANASNGPAGDPAERSMPGGGGKIIGEADERSGGINGI